MAKTNVFLTVPIALMPLAFSQQRKLWYCLRLS
uniref:Uncharacterized protein n=1 Tax=Arundo donax TaxID=35708 RepID=A0A0A9HAR6_ARUDO